MHHHTVLIAGFAALVAAIPAPQNIDFNQVNAAAPPAYKGPDYSATKQTITVNNDAGYAKATALATAKATALQNNKRGGGYGAAKPTTSACTTSAAQATSAPAAPAAPAAPSVACAVQPDGYGPKVQPDTTDAFLAYPEFASESKNCVTPSGYEQTFVDLNAAVSANTYLGLTTFTSYDVAQCGKLCDNTNLCTGFNIYVERDPSVDPGDDCPNPASITNYKCTLWGSGVDKASATNQGQWRDQFQVVITGSNGYSKTVSPSQPGYSQSGWDTPKQCGDGGHKAHSHPNTCLGQSFFPGPYNPGVCATYAKAQNAKNLSLVSWWMQMVYQFLNYAPYKCKFFNAYLLSKDGQPQGTYCSLFAQSYSPSQATYSPGVQAGSTWSISQSFSFDISGSASASGSGSGSGSASTGVSAAASATGNLWGSLFG
ncbi:hypothetical protein NHQ30_010290 [Ciborinia camelliae]|nr:hypothetical protein NHQ30_010290 [Ciborinia camelliae]